MTSRRKFLSYAMVLPAALAGASHLDAASSPVFQTEGFALQGYDPVAYFSENTPVAGRNAHLVKWMGSMWRFASGRNMAAFEANPWAYAPQYGGYCAYSMALGLLATTVPEAWTIYRGKLFLNFSTGVRQSWRLHMPQNIASANRYWPEILAG